MDIRLVTAVVFIVAVTAQNATLAPNTTVLDTGNTTTAAPTTLMTGAGNTTAAASTTAAANTTAASGAGNTTAAASTTAAANTTAAASTTAAANTTAASGAGNTTATASTTTAAMTTTTAPPLTPNTTVEVLNVPINSSGCGTQQLCAAQPSSCDPSTNGSCFFLGAQQQSGLNFLLSLSGISSGYIAATVSPGTALADNATTYVCANNNGVVKFISMLLNNGVLTRTVLNVNSVRGKVNGNKIQCTFAATVPSPSAKALGATLQISSGTYDNNTDSVGNPTPQLRSTVTDLGSPNATVTNSLSTNATTASPNTTNHGIPLQQSLMQALLATVGVLVLAML